MGFYPERKQSSRRLTEAIRRRDKIVFQAHPRLQWEPQHTRHGRTRKRRRRRSTSFMASWDNVAGATGYLLDVSTSDSFNDYVDGYHDLDVGNVTEQVVTDLTPGTTYYYRVRPYTAIDTAIGPGNYSEAMTATTVPATGLTSDVTATSPEGINLDVIGYDLVNAVVTTNAATNITSSSATLNGTVNPNGLTTAVHFEYGTTTNYGSTTANSNHTGNTTQNVSANITGLTSEYHVSFPARGNQ